MERFVIKRIVRPNPPIVSVLHPVWALLCVLLFSHSVLSQEKPQPNVDTGINTNIATKALAIDDQGCTLIAEPGQSAFDISAVQHDIPEGLIPEGAVIGDIVISRYPIFDHSDPKENYRLFQLADYLHIDTREKVVYEQLIFEPGDSYQQRIIEESARILRGLPFLYDARIWPYRVCGNTVDVEIVTREVWTITGGVGVERSGGNDETSFSLTDSNFLGRGELLSVTKTQSTDRDGIEFAYMDKSIRGSRLGLLLIYGDNDDGFVKTAKLERPFYSLDTRSAWIAYYNETKQNVDLYDAGDEIASFQSDEHYGELHWGFSEGLKGRITKRWWVGLHGETEDYEVVVDEPAPINFPQNRVINYPWVGFERIDDNFITTTNLNQIHRVEDFNLGASYSWRLGLAKESYGSDTDRVVYRGQYRNGWRFREKTLMQLKLSLDGMWQLNQHASEDSELSGAFRYYRSKSNRVGTYVALDFTYAYDLPAHKQILLGSEEGLRGFPSRYQDGDRKFLFTLERRYFTDWHPFRLFRIGFAAFFDAGRAWSPGEAKTDSTETLYNAGLGLRFASTRAQSNQVYHIDIGFPLNGGEDIDSYQVTLTARKSF